MRAIDEGRFKEEIVPIETPHGLFSVDEHPRRDTSLEKLASLKVLHPEIEGFSITAGNSSGANDAAAVLAVASSDLGLPALATVRVVGIGRRRSGHSPVWLRSRRSRRRWPARDCRSPTSICSRSTRRSPRCAWRRIKLLDIDPDQVNTSGSGCSLGHPVAATGARMLVTLVHELRRRGGGIGVAAMCAGGGMGSAAVIEVPAP